MDDALNRLQRQADFATFTAAVCIGALHSAGLVSDVSRQQVLEALNGGEWNGEPWRDDIRKLVLSNHSAPPPNG